MFDAERIAAEFCEFVRIPSISAREKAMAEELRERLQAVGLPTWYDDAQRLVDGEIGNLWSRIDATAGGKPTILLNAHMDTVTPGEDIEPHRDGERLCSLGDTILAADDKTGVAEILAVVREIVANPFPHGDILVCFTIAEETGLNGAKGIDYDSFSADCALVMDGGRTIGQICVGAPSATRMVYEIAGVAAHAGVRPEAGVSAIRAASTAIAGMRLGRIDEQTTSNIGIIEGGRAPNIIPASCRCVGEARSHDEDKLMRQVDHMRRCFEEACYAVGATLSVDEVSSYRAFFLPNEHPLVAAAMAVATELGHEPQPVRGGGGSDANVFNEHGIPAIIMPTGSADPHTLEESVNVEDMGRSADYLLAVIKKLQG
ncbi:MAG TPA: peptidase M20 [Armatimonadetes bacterium]|jgi:tripeptide aminopeptidase|nr:peptidase M20 [Armatimonadota bacterium]